MRGICRKVGKVVLPLDTEEAVSLYRTWCILMVAGYNGTWMRRAEVL
jgi:hypothetical protein